MTDEAHERDAATGSSAGADAAGADALRSWSDAAARPTWAPPIEPGSGPAADPAASGATGFRERVRRPSSLLADTPIPPRAAALRHSIGEKISAVTHHGDSPASVADPDVAGSGATMPAESLIQRVRTLVADRPEVVVGAAFAGGLVLATILKRLAR